MPRYAYQTPRARVYSYNYGYMNNYYKPMTHYVEKSERAVSEQPGHQSLAELRSLPPVWKRNPWDWDCVWIPPHETRTAPHFSVGSSHELILRYLNLRPWRHWFLDQGFRTVYEIEIPKLEVLEEMEKDLVSKRVESRALVSKRMESEELMSSKVESKELKTKEVEMKQLAIKAA